MTCTYGKGDLTSLPALNVHVFKEDALITIIFCFVVKEKSYSFKLTTKYDMFYITKALRAIDYRYLYNFVNSDF